MAYGRDIRAAIERLFGLPEGALDYAYRVLRESGHLSTGGRGRAAAKLTPRDAASLLIAATCVWPTRRLAESWLEYANLPAAGGECRSTRPQPRSHRPPRNPAPMGSPARALFSS